MSCQLDADLTDMKIAAASLHNGGLLADLICLLLAWSQQPLLGLAYPAARAWRAQLVKLWTS